eukprot:scaffold10482_cov89-Skeletonema_marinoi.AAC.1
MMTRHPLQQSSSCLFQLYTKLLPILMILMLLMTSCVCSDIKSSSSSDAAFHLPTSSSPSSDYHLRGHFNREDITSNNNSQLKLQQQQFNDEQQHRAIKADSNPSPSQPATTTTILLTTSPPFQIITSTLLTLLILLQLLLLHTYIRQRTKRVLEFAQPIVICIFVTCSIITTAACFLYVYTSAEVICVIREPIVFVSVSAMGATVGGRAWRISTLWNNPLLTVGRGSDGGGTSGRSVLPRVEQVRQWTLRLLSVLSGCECSGVVGLISKHTRQRKNANSSSSGGGGRPIRVQITFVQMMRATVVMILPQLLWQIVVMSVPMLRSSRELLSYNNRNYNDQMEVTMEQYQCQSSVGFWPNYVSIVLTLLPFAIAYLLNVRPKSELDQLPEIIDEREHLKQSFYIVVRVLVVAVPMIGLTYQNNPEAKAYGAICA